MIKREQEKSILESAKYFPVVSILGPRQSGKTTLAKHVFKNHKYFSLEDPDIRLEVKKDPRTFLTANKNKYGIIIDEFQYVPELLSYIQVIVDEEKIDGYFILTGSQNFLMNQNITQSLAGRVSIHTLLPLSITELKNADLLPEEVEDVLFKGCYPGVYSKNIPPNIFYSSYLQTYIERDVRLLTEIGNLDTFQNFIVLCATRVGQLLNISSLGNECGISDKTVKKWLSILEASYIIYKLIPHHISFGKRLVKSYKIFFYDPGLASYLLKVKDKSELVFNPYKGGLFESFIISDFFKFFYNKGERPNIYFWQDRLGNEIDCLIEEALKFIPVEIKSGRTSSSRFYDSLKYWHKIYDKKITHKDTHEGYVIYAGSQRQPIANAQLVSWQNIEKIYKNF